MRLFRWEDFHIGPEQHVARDIELVIGQGDIVLGFVMGTSLVLFDTTQGPV